MEQYVLSPFRYVFRSTLQPGTEKRLRWTLPPCAGPAGPLTAGVDYYDDNDDNDCQWDASTSLLLKPLK